MAILLGTQSIWNSTFGDVNEALRVQLDFDYYFAVLSLAVAMLSLAPFIIVGNLSVITAFWKDPNKELHAAPSNILLVSLALNDLIFGALKSPLTFYYFIYTVAFKQSPFSCTILISLSGFLGVVSVLHLLALSIDRYVAVLIPLKYVFTVTKQRSYIAAASIWGYSMIIGLISNGLENIVSSGSLLVVHVVIPWCCLTFLNARIVYTMRKTTGNLKANVFHVQMKLLIKRERKVFNLVLLVLGVFTFCYVPWLIAIILILTCLSCNLKALIYVYCLSAVLIDVSPLIHPFLYTWRLPKFRKTLLYYLKERKAVNPRAITDSVKQQDLQNA